jgi:hypothetical protein
MSLNSLITEADDGITILLQVLCSHTVIVLLLLMNFSVNFHNQPTTGTVKIDNEPTHRILAAPAETA